MLLVEDSSKILSLNAAAARLFKMELEEVRGQYWAGLDGQLNTIVWKKRFKELQNSGNLYAYQTDLVTSDELLRPVDVEIVPEGKNMALLTLHNRLAEAIDKADLELLSEESEVGFWMYNRVDDILYTSPYLRCLADLPDEGTALEIVQSLQGRLLVADWGRLRPQVKGLLEEAGAFNQLIRFEGAKGTLNLQFFVQSTGNDLHVTRLFGMVRQQNNLTGTESAGSVSGELAAFSIDQANDMIFWSRPDGTLAYANQIVSDKLGYPKEAFVNMEITTFLPSFDEETRNEFWENLREAKSFETDFILTASSGGQVEISANVNYLRFGDVEYACSFCRDQTETNKLKRRQLLTQYTVDNSRDMILWSSPRGNLVFANETFLLRSGYEWEEIYDTDARVFFDHLTDEYREKAWQRLRAGETLDYETSLNLHDGNRLQVSAKVTYLEYEGQEFNCIYLRDLTKKKKRDTQLVLSREALNSSPDCILWLTANYRVQYANATLLNMIGVKKGQLDGQLYSKIFPELDQQSIEDSATLTVTLRTTKVDNRKLNLNCSRVSYSGQYFFMLLGRDITEMANRQQSLEEANVEISQLKDRLEKENVTLRQEVSVNYNVNNIITVSPKYQKVLQQVGRVADVNTTVLITGETGTGKELLARAIHQLSDRADSPLIKVNCAALPENLIESELFGHEKGAFTGAIGRKVGRFEMADQGTLFLDEVGELPLELQSKLLRVLQEDEFERLGGTETITVDVRVVAATNRNLQQMVGDGTFRADLYYRLNVFPIENMALRDRPEDIPVLVEYFTRKFAKRQNKEILKINAKDMDRLKKYAFPGNIRELENLVERAVVLSQSETLSIQISDAAANLEKATSQKFYTFEEMQKRHIIEALIATEGRVTGPRGAGVLLGLNDRTLVSKMRKLGIRKIDYLEAFS